VVVSTETPSADEEQGSEDETVPRQKRVFVPNWSTIIACVLFLILVGEHVVPLLWPVIDAYLHPKATVTLFAAKQPLTFRYTFLAVTGTTDQSQQQIPSRLLSFTTPTKQTAIHTTGIGYTPAVQAGTVLTGSDGVRVLMDETASIPAGNAPTFGIATVPAHAMVGGTEGNIAPLDINGLCCLAGIAVKNTTAFTGGKDPQAHPTVSPTDLTTAAHQLASVLDPLARNGLQRQIAETQREVVPVQCSYNTLSTPTVGERATEARVSVSEVCKTLVIDYTALQEQARLRFAADASKTLGWGELQGNSLSLTLSPPVFLDSSHHTYKLAVTASGILVFHLSETQLQTLVTQIAGKRITQAQQQLLTIKGVQGVSIQPARQGETILPADPNQIHLVLS